jgi:hypothetical protein
VGVRAEIEALNFLGPLPSEKTTDAEHLRKYGELIRAIDRPVTDEEARVLIELFGPDGCFGLASSIMHLIETAPGWPLEDCLHDPNNEWKVELRDRAVRGGLLREKLDLRKLN